MKGDPVNGTDPTGTQVLGAEAYGLSEQIMAQSGGDMNKAAELGKQEAGRMLTAATLVVGGPAAGRGALIIGGSTGGAVAGVVSVAKGNSPDVVAKDTGKGVLSGLATAAAGARSMLSGKFERAGAQAFASASAAKASGGSDAEASIAAVATGTASILIGPKQAPGVGEIVRQVVQNIERKALGAGIKEIPDDRLKK